jgi:hypothetical protein
VEAVAGGSEKFADRYEDGVTADEMTPSSVERFHLWRFERGDPINLRLAQGGQIRRRHHAAIRNEKHTAKLEALLELLDRARTV